jgi:flagella basal body P-ring formation protein FlgA
VETPLLNRLLRLAGQAMTLAVFGACAIALFGTNPVFAATTAGDPAALLKLQVRHFVSQTVVVPEGGRYELTVGEVDSRLRLAPCNEVRTYLPANAKLWGKSRIGLRCVNGPARWNVYLPVTVHIYGKALVAAAPLVAGHVLTQADLKLAEINLSEESQLAMTIPGMALGRTLSRPVAAGEGLRPTSLKARQWFARGDTVSIRAVGSGFAAVGRGEALTAGLEGQAARVRTESGKVISGKAVAEQQLEIAL